MKASPAIRRKFVLADPGTCIGCKTCMAACLMRHDAPGDVSLPRLTLVTTRTVSAPVGCHHCADAPCVDACPVGCLYADDEHVGAHKEKCIGCRNCILACPYGAIEIVTRPVDPEPAVACAASAARTGGSAAASVEKDGEPKSARERARAKKRKRSISTVVKCDLCVDHADGPACVRACPTNSLRLIDEQYLERGKQAKRKAAAYQTAAYSTIALNFELDEER